jgi:hypothetical protein
MRRGDNASCWSKTLELQKRKTHSGRWVLLSLIAAISLVAVIESPPSEQAPRTKSPENPGCLELSDPTTNCLTLLQKIGFSTSFARSGWTAFHYAVVWHLAAHGRGGEKFDRSVYAGRVVPSLNAARGQARNSKERTLLLHESGALENLRLHDGYSGLRTSEIDPDKLQAFRAVIGTTPEQFAQLALQGADHCMMALNADPDPRNSSKEFVEAARSVSG